MSKHFFLVLGLALLLAILLLVGPDGRTYVAAKDATAASRSLTLTIYNGPLPGGSSRHMAEPGGLSGYAVVKDQRVMTLTKGRGALRFTDVAASIDPATVRFESLTDPDHTAVIEQNFQYDLVSAEKILTRYIDREISVVTPGGAFSGTLLSFDHGSLALATGEAAQPVQIISRGEQISRLGFGELPGGLITRPTLVWEVQSAKGGDHLVQVSYMANQVGWEASYSVVLSADERSGKVTGWATIGNHSGATFTDARIKLVAGDVQRVEAPQVMGREMLMDKAMASPEEAQFEEKSFFEYHMYTLRRASTIPDQSLKQIELFPPALKVPVSKRYVYSGVAWRYGWGGYAMTGRDLGLECNKKVDVYVGFDNRVAAGMGIPLPRGVVRLLKEDPDDGSLEFIGEDRIDHTPKDESILLKVGSAFDVTGERIQKDYDEKGRQITETFEITIRNHKKEAVVVTVREYLYRWSSWSIVSSSRPFVKQDSHAIDFDVTVKPDGTEKVSYTVRYQGW